MRYHFVNHHSLIMNLKYIKVLNDENAEIYCDGNLLRIVLTLLSIKNSYWPGPDFLADLIRRLGQNRTSDTLIIFANKEQCEIAARVLNFDYKSCICDEIFTGDNELLQEFIRKVEPKEEVIICIGSPWQDIIAKRLCEFEIYNKCNIYCIGAAMNYELGIYDRNKFFVKYKLEWLNRLIAEPSKTAPRIIISTMVIIVIALMKPSRIREFFSVK